LNKSPSARKFWKNMSEYIRARELPGNLRSPEKVRRFTRSRPDNPLSRSKPPRGMNLNQSCGGSYGIRRPEKSDDLKTERTGDRFHVRTLTVIKM
jgi:hypothetical protein